MSHSSLLENGHGEEKSNDVNFCELFPANYLELPFVVSIFAPDSWGFTLEVFLRIHE